MSNSDIRNSYHGSHASGVRCPPPPPPTLTIISISSSHVQTPGCHPPGRRARSTFTTISCFLRLRPDQESERKPSHYDCILYYSTFPTQRFHNHVFFLLLTLAVGTVRAFGIRWCLPITPYSFFFLSFPPFLLGLPTTTLPPSAASRQSVSQSVRRRL